LYNAITTTYGAGDGSTTFNLPNLVGRTALGVGTSTAAGATAHTLGQVAGEEKHTLLIAELAAHGHGNNTGTESGYHQHGQYVLANGAAGSGQRIDYAGDRAFAGAFPQGVNTDSQNALHTHPIPVDGSGTPFNLLAPYVALNWIIRAIPSAGTDTTTVQYFKGYVPAGTSVAFTGGANMPFATRIDVGNYWSTANNNWVVPTNGRYRITAACRSNSSVARRNLMIYKNGAQFAISPDSVNDAYAGGLIVDVLDLVAGDTIAVRPSASITTNADTGENTYLIIESVGLEASATVATSSVGVPSYGDSITLGGSVNVTSTTYANMGSALTFTSRGPDDVFLATANVVGLATSGLVTFARFAVDGVALTGASYTPHLNTYFTISRTTRITGLSAGVHSLNVQVANNGAGTSTVYGTESMLTLARLAEGGNATKNLTGLGTGLRDTLDSNYTLTGTSAANAPVVPGLGVTANVSGPTQQLRGDPRSGHRQRCHRRDQGVHRRSDHHRRGWRGSDAFQDLDGHWARCRLAHLRSAGLVSGISTVARSYCHCDHGVEPGRGQQPSGVQRPQRRRGQQRCERTGGARCYHRDRVRHGWGPVRRNGLLYRVVKRRQRDRSGVLHRRCVGGIAFFGRV
jgi:microcystin-dependent protein